MKSLVAGSLVALLLVGTRGHATLERPLLLQGTVVTMDAAHHVLQHGKPVAGLAFAAELRPA